MKNLQQYGTWALVAGAAEGLGAAFSEELAKRGLNLILVDKDEEKLCLKAVELKKKYRIEVKTSLTDLATAESATLLLNLLNETGCRLIIYNAAYGPVKRFTDNTEEELNYYIDVNSRTPMQLVHRLSIEKPGQGPIGFLLMSSLAGMWGTSLVAPYAATKAFNLNLSEALYYELKPQNIDVMACIAGATDTPNFRSTNPKKPALSPTPMKPEKVVSESLKKLGKRPYYVPGFSNRLTVFFLSRILGRKSALRIMNRTMKGMYE